jgi:PKD repeat protein
MIVRKMRYLKPVIICTIVLGMLVLGSVMNVVADEPPVADADPDHQTVIAGEEAWFTGSASYDSDGYIVAYYWVFGDGICYEGENMTYTFNTLGNFTVSLTVIDDFGNQDTDYVTVNVVEEPPSEPLMVWIESLGTDKDEYNVNETVFTQATVQRGNDLLTYVWEGTLVLEVLDQSFVIIYNDERSVYLPYGGTSETHEFEFILTESGDYFVKTSLYDMHDDLLDVKEVCITVGDDGSGGNGTHPPPNKEKLVWIESLTTDKNEYEVNEVVETEVIVKRGNDHMDYVWKGILILEVFDEAMALVYYDEQEVTIPCDGWTQTFNYEFTLTTPGDHLVRATLYDIHDELMDIKELCITVGDDNSGGNGTKPPNDEIRMVWIESLTTDKQEYDVDEVIETTVIVKRGDDLLTYVWEGTLVFEVFDKTMALVFTDDRQVYLPCGGTTETHNFEYTLSELGDYLVRATLYDFENNQIDEMEICITVSGEPSGGNGTVPPNMDSTEPPGDNGMGLSNKDKTGTLQFSSVLQISLIAIVSIALTALSAIATGRYLKRFRDKEQK